MSDLQELTNELMQDPEFKSEYEARYRVDVSTRIRYNVCCTFTI